MKKLTLLLVIAAFAVGCRTSEQCTSNDTHKKGFFKAAGATPYKQSARKELSCNVPKSWIIFKKKRDNQY